MAQLYLKGVYYDTDSAGLWYLDNSGSYQEISVASSSYLVYTALLNQTGTDAPVPTVLQNTLGGAIIWTYNSQGLYIGTLNGAFPTGKVAIFFGNTFSGEYAYAGDINSAPDSIYVNPYQYNGATFQWDASNNILVNTPINILVFQ